MGLDQKQIKAIIYTVGLILTIILLFLIFAVLFISTSKEENTNINISIGFSSIKDIVQHYNCEYKNDTYSKNREYQTEVNLIFKCDLYENNISNEKFFNQIIKDIVSFVNYTNVKLIDTTREITIEVTCKNGKIQRTIINGKEDYFIYMDSQYALTQYEKINTISLIPDDMYLVELLNNDWESNTNFGTRESIFKNYNICFDEGIEYRKIGSKIYNVVFTKQHIGSVVNGLSVGIDLSSIENYLGKPAFKDEKMKVIGYKGSNLYAFFTEDEISIYRCIDYNYDEFWSLCDKFLNDELDFKEFMNELTYLWTDYSEYTYDTDYMFISYPNRGVDVKLNYEEISGIVLYNNISEDIATTKRYLEHTEFISRLQIDNVFEAEKRRIESKNSIEYSYKEFENELKEKYKDDEIALYAKKSALYNYYMTKDDSENTVTTYFISKDKSNVNRELNEAVDTYLWVNDRFFIYSIYRTGIYLYNLENGMKIPLIEGNKSYKIESYQDGILSYDGGNEVLIQF